MLSREFTVQEIEGVASTLESAVNELRAALVRMDESGLSQIFAHFATTKDNYADKVFNQCEKLHSMVKREILNQGMNAPGAAESSVEAYSKRKTREISTTRNSGRKKGA